MVIGTTNSTKTFIHITILLTIILYIMNGNFSIASIFINCNDFNTNACKINKVFQIANQMSNFYQSIEIINETQSIIYLIKTIGVIIDKVFLFVVIHSTSQIENINVIAVILIGKVSAKFDKKNEIDSTTNRLNQYLFIVIITSAVMYLIQTVVINCKVMFKIALLILALHIWYKFKQTAIGMHIGNEFLLFYIISIVALIIEQIVGVVSIDGTMIQIILGTILQHSFVYSVHGDGAIGVKMGQKRVKEG